MKLRGYLSSQRLAAREFSRRIGVSPAAVARYASGRRIPSMPVMHRIVAETEGAVTPNDFYDVAVPRDAPASPNRTMVKLHIDSDLADEADRLGTDIGAVAERALVQAITEAKRAKWREENRVAVAEANEELARNGLWSDGLRLF
jgi:post-segregation antitoxin (ccd killing protein)